MGIDAQLVASLREAHEDYSKPVAGVHKIGCARVRGGQAQLSPPRGRDFRGVNV